MTRILVNTQLIVDQQKLVDSCWHENLIADQQKNLDMEKYRIVYTKGEYKVLVGIDPNTCVAKVLDGSNSTLGVISGTDETELYFGCRQWASLNIRGEFQVVELPAANAEQPTFQSAAA